jgi:acyl-coenzyme A synthetase/AMP-(fatty) acid ligase
MVKNYKVLQKYDLSSVRVVFSGAAPLGAETIETLQKQWPSWQIHQGYGKLC